MSYAINYVMSEYSCHLFQNIEYQAEVKKIEAEHQAALEDFRR